MRTELEGVKKTNTKMHKTIMDNLGLILRLMFLKAQWVGNNLYKKHRTTPFRGVKNMIKDTKILKNIWDKMGQDQPRAYWPYFSSNKLERIWRKHEISE